MSKEDLRKLDQEDEKLVHEIESTEKFMTVGKLLGFRLPKNKCFVPPVPCGKTAAPLMSIVPMYDTVLLPIYSHYWTDSGKKLQDLKISKVSVFKKLHGLTPSDIKTLAEKGRIIPYFESAYRSYNREMISPLLESGVPIISPSQMASIRGAPITWLMEEKGWGDKYNSASVDLQKFEFPKGKDCATCLSACYMLGLRDYFHGSKFRGWLTACFVSYALSIRLLDAVLQTECDVARDVLGNIGDLPEGLSIDYILKGLKVKYSPDIPLEEYADIFDGKTSKALRRIVEQLLNDPFSRKYTRRLSARIYDLNQQIEELRQGRAAKVFEAVSDMALYGGKKFIESQSQRYIRIPKKGFIKLGEWLASKGVDLEAKLQKKDWALAQLYKARCKLKRCTK